MSEQENIYHVPALLTQTVDGLNIREDGVYVDVTFGGGGHSREILKRLSQKGRLIVFDQDEDAKRNLPNDSRITFCHSNFRYISNFIKYLGAGELDGILADLGVSFHHFDEAERGFSFRFDGALDMRMNTSARTTASDVINGYATDQLTEILSRYGELQKAGRIARIITDARKNGEIKTISQFCQILEPALAYDKQKKDLAKVFQAIRIEVNDEMGALRDLLMSSGSLLKVGGRLSVLTYHSLEDRMVKSYMKTGVTEGTGEKDFYGRTVAPLKVVNNKVITPDDNEVEANPRARSAKLRIAEKI